jgi:glucodextranase-like protein/zinc ribbon protein
MTESGHRFCPRCGNALQPGMAFCPGCGLKVGEVGELGAAVDRYPDEGRRDGGGGSWKARIIVALVLVAIGAIGALMFTRPGASIPGVTPGPGNPGGGNQVTPTATPVAAPITGLTITSPTDGQVVATKEVTVIGLAPPGLTVTQDISLRPDQHTTVDGTGHWAIKVGLDDGENRLTFRIGDDQSTKKTIRVIYTPPAP